MRGFFYFVVMLLPLAGIDLYAMASLSTSKEMRTIVESLKDGKTGISVKGLPRSKEEEARKAIGIAGMEVYDYPRNGREDAFAYRIYYNKTTREYWVWKTGGIAMVSEYYGPMKLALNFTGKDQQP